MRRSLKIIVFTFFAFYLTKVHGQSHYTDSLLKLIKKSGQDTVRAKLLLRLISEYNHIGDFKAAKIKEYEAIDLCQKLNYKTGLAVAFGNLGITYQYAAQYDSSLIAYTKSLRIDEELKNRSGVANIRGNLSLVYSVMGDLNRSLEEVEKALAINTELGRKSSMAGNYSTIATNYYYRGNLPATLEYFLKSLKIYEELNDKVGCKGCINNIGIIYGEQKDYKNALAYFEKALKLDIEMKEILTINAVYYNIGSVYLQEKKYDLALKFLKKGLEYSRETNQKGEICGGLTNIATTYLEMGNYEQALIYGREDYSISNEIKNKKELSGSANVLSTIFLALHRLDSALYYANVGFNIAKESGLSANFKEANKNLSDIYVLMKKQDLALIHYKTFIALRDSFINTEKTQELTRKTMNFEFDKQREKQKAEQEIKDIAVASSKKHQQLVTFSVILILLLVSVFSLFLYKRYKLTIEQKLVIENQKTLVEEKNHEIEEKNKDIIDSITYAKRLQDAILPSLDEVDRVFTENFILYKPKDIVAGDFYWMHRASVELSTSAGGGVSPREMGEAVLIAAADCTGHGVPGALVSIVCSNALNRTVNEFKIIDPGNILDKTRELVIETFSKSTGEVKDGMDISLLSIQKAKEGYPFEVKWAGANNALLYIKNNELLEIKPDKQPIGIHSAPVPFTTKNISLNKGDSIYLFTDGLADQFGGAKGKKFKLKKLKEVLLANNYLPLKEQKKTLEDTFTGWRGELEQVDDILIIGIRL